MEREIWIRNYLLGSTQRGQKTLEIRPWTHHFSKFKKGDILNFNNRFRRKILALRTYENILLLLEQEVAHKIFPDLTAGEILAELKKVYPLEKLLGPWLVIET